MLANRKLFILHQRNQTALSGLHIKGHDGDHEEMEQQFRRILGDPAIPARDRVRLSCAPRGAPEQPDDSQRPRGSQRPGLGQQRPVRPVRVELDILPRLPRTAVSEEALTES